MSEDGSDNGLLPDDILSFSEDLLGTYDDSVQAYYTAAISLRYTALRQLCETSEISKTVGDPNRWNKKTMVRDLMSAGFELESGEKVAPEVVARRWLPEPAFFDQSDKASERDDADDEDLDSHDSFMDKKTREEIRNGNQVVLDFTSSPPPVSDGSKFDKYVRSMHDNMVRMQRIIATQQLEIVRIRSKKDISREYGVGVNPNCQLRADSKDLLWKSDVNPFEQKPLTSPEYHELCRDNSSDSLDLCRRAGLGETESSFCNKTKEFSVKDVFEKFTKPMLHRLEPVVTTLLTAHSCAGYSMDSLDTLSGASCMYKDKESGETRVLVLPVPVRDKIRQMEVDVELAQQRIAAAVELINSETARMCSMTQLAIAKKMSMGAAQQLQLSKTDESEKTASMLTDAFIKTLEEQRKQKKNIDHALNAKSKQQQNRGNQHSGRGRGGARPKPGKGKGKQNNPKKPTNTNNNSKSPSAVSPGAGRGAGKK